MRSRDGKIQKSTKALSLQHLKVAPQLCSLVLVHGQPHQRHLHGGALQQPRVGSELPRLGVEARRHRFKHQVYVPAVAWKDHSCGGKSSRKQREGAAPPVASALAAVRSCLHLPEDWLK